MSVEIKRAMLRETSSRSGAEGFESGIHEVSEHYGSRVFRCAQSRDDGFSGGGKPFLKDGPFFNIRNSYNKIVLAISFEGPVGVDIEFIKPRPKFKKVMKKFFTKEEQDHVGDSLEKFYDLWTQKEAFVKLIGGSILSKEFKHHATFDVIYRELELEGFKGYVCCHGDKR